MFILLVPVPVLASLVYSTLYSTGLTGLLSEGFTWTHWRTVYTEGSFVHSLWYSICIAMVSIGLALLAAFYLALTFKQELENKTLSYFLFLPMGIPAVVAAFFSFQMLSPSGWLSRFTQVFGWTSNQDQFPSLVNDSLAIGIICTHVFLAVPYFTFLFRNIYRQEKGDDLLRVATNLGSNKMQARNRIIIPLLLQKAAPSVVMFLIFVFGSYEIPLLLGTSSKRMLSPLVADKMFRFDLLDKPQAHAMLVAYMLFIILVNAILFRRVVQHAN